MSFFGRVGKKAQGQNEYLRSADIEGLPRFEYSKLVDKEEIGRGGLAAVFTAVLPANNEKIVVKKYLDSDETTKKMLLKEARLLRTLNHANIVELKGICVDQFAILLEYVYFDFMPICANEEVINSLAEFLSVCERSSCDGVNTAVFFHAAMDVASGLQYLHMNDMAHRDLKPANILVSNHHYRDLREREKIELMSSIKPSICKLADFGESRSKDIHTNQAPHYIYIAFRQSLYSFPTN